MQRPDGPGAPLSVSMPFYVAPEQQMKDRADFARKGIARGRSVIVLRYADGILFVAENRSQALHKVSEIYDRIGFAAVGRYNEFENLRTAGIRYADLRGYSYDRTDVTGRGLANAYAQLLGTIFSSGGEKPYEVEIVVAELGPTAETDQIYRLTYDGSVADENGFAVMGGSAEAITETVAPAATSRAWTWPPPSSWPCARWPPTADRTSRRASWARPRSRWRSSIAPARCPGSSAGSTGSWLTGLLADGPDVEPAPPDPGPEAPPAVPPAEVPRDRARAHGRVSTGLPDRPTPAPWRAARVVVIGVGLIGASIGCALTQRGWPVHLRDAKSSHARVAETPRGRLHRAHRPRPTVDLVVVAVPPRRAGRRWSARPCETTRRPPSPTSAR